MNCDLLSPDTLDTRIGERASAKYVQHCIFLQITTLLDTMMKEVGDVKEAAGGISELKRKLAEVFLMVEAFG